MMMTFLYLFVVTSTAFLHAHFSIWNSAYSYRRITHIHFSQLSSSKQIRNERKFKLKMDTSPKDSQSVKELEEDIAKGDYKSAYRLIKRNPMLNISKDEGRVLLNNIDQLDPNGENFEKNQKQVIDSSVYLYRRLERQKVLKGFGCVEGEYPEKSLDISPAKLEELTGLSIMSLTPKERTTYWQLAGILFCAFEYIVGINIGIDPLFTLIPITFFLFGVDQFFYKGAVFETIYRTLFPEYEKKIISHEAGHFLIAYLLGVPVRGCVTNSWDAMKNPDIKGQAGTIFFDAKLAEEMDNQQVTRNSLDRLSIVVMAGIAAEALKFGKAEGGAVDEQSLIGLLNSIQPPWNILRIQGQARWAVLQAILLIKEHINSYNALVTALEEKKSVGDCVFAIEENLPAELPSWKRLEERQKKRRNLERDSVLRYIQRMTWSVGGIDVEEGNVALDNSVASTAMNDSMDIIKKQSRVAPLDEDVLNFTAKIRKLEEAVQKEDSQEKVDGTSTSVPALTSVGSLDIEKPEPSLSPSATQVKSSSLDFETELATSRLTSSAPAPTSVAEAATSTSSSLSAEGLLISHRGYQMKLLENLDSKKRKESVEIDQKLRELHDSIEKASLMKSLVRK
mmetsp:Transcript_13333/g.19991  ORF Transcript_13333/g.19991 Transcript_13333/m.19991 type:complete len:621 (-) Transcript_13333:2346-4208(-)